MRYTIGTVYRACTLKIDIAANKQCQVNLEVCDAKQPFTYFTKRFRMFAPGENQSLYVQMPITGKNILITIFEEGTDPNSNSASFTVVKMKLLPLVRQMSVVPPGRDVSNFIPFAERFAFNAGVLPTYATTRLYISRWGNIKIRYVDTITDEGTTEQLTPARIGIYDKIIEVSKAKFKPMTVPMRLCILFHEFSHLYLNKKMTDEEEADLNGLQIYLALGYPRIEAHETFLSTFYQAQTEVNYDRYERISSFIDKFEQLNSDNT